MSAVSHVKSDTIADFTGTFTGFNSEGSTTTIAATDVIRPSDWNSVHNQFYTLTGNTTGNSTASGTGVLYAGSGGIVLGGSTGTVVFSKMVHNGYAPFNAGDESVVGQQGNATIHLYPLQLGINVQFDRFANPIQFTGATNSTGTYTISLAYLFYTRSNETRIDLFTSWSGTTQLTHSGTASSASIVGPRLWTFGATGTLSEGDYIVGVWSRTSSGGANATISQWLVSQPGSAFSGRLNAAANATLGWKPFMGQYTSTTTGVPFPASIAKASVIVSGSIAMRPPIWEAWSQYT
jgi:hypothetical protein